MTKALLLLLLAAPEALDTPQAAVDRLATAVRKVDLLVAYDQLGDGGRKLLDKELVRSCRMLGLDPATATPRQIVAEFEKRFATDAGKELIRGFEIAVLDSDESGDRATAKVQVTLGGRRETVTLVLARKNGRWSIDGVDTSKARSRANETAAIATLRNINSAQAQFQASGMADVNRNGNGEYGTFGELSGTVGVRGGEKLAPPVLGPDFGKVDRGVVTRHGYHFRIYLCDAKGSAIGEEQGTKEVDADKAETTWCCYAWPVEYGGTGKRSFFLNQYGDILEVDHKGYNGKAGPRADAAFNEETAKDRITGTSAINAVGRDGNRWKPVP